MRKGSYSDTIEKYATVPQACDYYKLGRNTLMNLLDGTGAIKRFGKSVRIGISDSKQSF